LSELIINLYIKLRWKVFLSLAVAVLTVVSCKSWSSAEEVVADTTAVAVDSVVVDTTAIAVDSAAVEAPAE
jgi:hypothetical protein